MSKGNRPQDIPSFDISKRGRIEADFYRMNHGYLIIDQDTGQKSAVRGESDIEEIFLNIADDVKETLKERLENKGPDEFISLTIILEDQAVEPQPDLQDIEGPQQVDIGQIAEVVNDIINGQGGLGVPGIRRNRVSAQDLVTALSSRRMVSIRTRVKDQNTWNKGGKTQEQTNNFQGKKHFHDNSKNYPQHNKDRNENKDQSESTKIV